MTIRVGLLQKKLPDEVHVYKAAFSSHSTAVQLFQGLKLEEEKEERRRQYSQFHTNS